MGSDAFLHLLGEDRRLTILRLLDKAEGSLNNAVLHVGVLRKGHRIGLDRLTNELNWLAAQGLVTVRPDDGLMVAELTYRGQDVARGLTRHPGVKEPIPGLE
jgi:DNA-binding transcriptional ArsR family regulator